MFAGVRRLQDVVRGNAQIPCKHCHVGPSGYVHVQSRNRREIAREAFTRQRSTARVCVRPPPGTPATAGVPSFTAVGRRRSDRVPWHIHGTTTSWNPARPRARRTVRSENWDEWQGRSGCGRCPILAVTFDESCGNTSSILGVASHSDRDMEIAGPPLSGRPQVSSRAVRSCISTSLTERRGPGAVHGAPPLAPEPLRRLLPERWRRGRSSTPRPTGPGRSQRTRRERGPPPRRRAWCR